MTIDEFKKLPKAKKPGVPMITYKGTGWTRKDNSYQNDPEEFQKHWKGKV